MSSSRSKFFVALTQELMAGMNKYYGPENWDPDRFGAHPSNFKRSLITKFNQMFSGRFAVMPTGRTQQQIENVSRIEDSLEGLAWVYDLLADDYSKSILIKVLAYRLMGHEGIKLPLNTAAYWSQRADLSTLIKSGDAIKISCLNLELNHLALEKVGYPIELYLPPGGVVVTFILKQYEYGKRKPEIKARGGDYVIDAGGCWGDTALYFAHEVGEPGRVCTFEFTPENLEIFHRNLKLNPGLANRIDVVTKALWDKSGEVIRYSANGPGTSMSRGQQNGEQENSLQVTTVSIDDFVDERRLPRVDYIKMDIEGAELNALKGAEATIRAFRPQLAISVYHRETDLVDIPAYLENLGVGYEFYLDHFTIYGEETVLFATPTVVQAGETGRDFLS